jgi:AraC-like DNA-binding protein
MYLSSVNCAGAVEYAACILRLVIGSLKIWNPAMSPLGTIRMTAAQEFLSAVKRRRPDDLEFAARAGLSRDCLRSPTGMMPLAVFVSMLEAAALETGNSTLGLDLGKEFQLSALGPVARLVATAPTLGAGLEMFTRHFGSIQTNTVCALHVGDGTARLVYSIMDPAVRFRAQDAAFTLAVQYSMLSSLLGAAWSAVGVDFEHLPGADLPIYQRHFSCPLRFGRSENALLFPATLLNAQMRDMDENLHRRLEADLADAARGGSGRLSLIESVEAWITASLSRTVPTDIEIAAADFGMTARSFQRALAHHQVSYLEIRNSVRSHIAKCLLSETTLPVTTIALQLGYSETSAFSRGFKLQVGETPIDFRRRAAGIVRLKEDRAEEGRWFEI